LELATSSAKNGSWEPKVHHIHQLIGLPGNLTFSLEQTCFAAHLFLPFLGLEEYSYKVMQGLFSLISILSLACVAMFAGTTLDFGLVGVGVIFFWRWLGRTKTHAVRVLEYSYKLWFACKYCLLEYTIPVHTDSSTVSILASMLVSGPFNLFRCHAAIDVKSAIAMLASVRKGLIGTQPVTQYSSRGIPNNHLHSATTVSYQIHARLS